MEFYKPTAENVIAFKNLDICTALRGLILLTNLRQGG
jgi:hypothetical protein